MKAEADARREAELAAREREKAEAAERRAQQEAAAHAAQERAKVEVFCCVCSTSFDVVVRANDCCYQYTVAKLLHCLTAGRSRCRAREACAGAQKPGGRGPCHCISEVAEGGSPAGAQWWVMKTRESRDGILCMLALVSVR